MTTIELAGGPHDGMVRDVPPDFPDLDIAAIPISPGHCSPVGHYRLAVPAVTTQAGRVRYDWVKPEVSKS